MAYVRKTKDVFVLQANYGYGDGWEDLFEEETRKEAKEQLKCYNENEVGVPHRIITRRVKIEEGK